LYYNDSKSDYANFVENNSTRFVCYKWGITLAGVDLVWWGNASLVGWQILT
jgi:hypothetical protein